MQNEIKSMVKENIKTGSLVLNLAPQIENATKLVINALKNSKKIIFLVCLIGSVSETLAD